MVELLSPAGSYEGFLGAIHAGADAVYLAGNQYGARAYAHNFTEDEIIAAITYAHLFQRKVYLTVNTLVKEQELKELYTYLYPLYQAKLDGVIIQDMGVFQFVKRNFPDLELHCSTQMAITGKYGATHLQKMGASRIVVARELGLQEIHSIVQEVDVEIEMFVHGAMCYAYSGNCLFSSMIGGRSGNRGKCAQPCRLPYQLEHISEQEEYLLSLKDLCLLPQLQSVLETGVHSLKIEGRMKKPEYTAGVTAIYRKYIDAYYRNPHEKFVIYKKDLQLLRALYMRSELSLGYCNEHNSADMVTLAEPSYAGVSADVLGSIRKMYVQENFQIPIAMKVAVRVGQPIEVIITHDKYGSVTIAGEVVQEAQNHPLVREGVTKQFEKMGGTPYKLTELDISIEGNCFLSVKGMNEARRQAVEAMEERILEPYAGRNRMSNGVSHRKQAPCNIRENHAIDHQLHVGVLTLEQLKAVVHLPEISRLYVSSDLWKLSPQGSNYPMEYVRQDGNELYVALPYIVRKRSYPQLEYLANIIQEHYISGVLVRNMESLEWLETIGYTGKIILDSNVYSFNTESYDYYKEKGYEVFVPYELNQGELRQMPFAGESYYCYGKVPMMISANCVAKTKEMCQQGNSTFVSLIDRYNKKLPVYLNCNYCYNVIYNSVPLSLHQTLRTFVKKYRLQATINFTNETAEEVVHLIGFYKECLIEKRKNADEIGIAYTKGHLKRGVE
ncbi:MAG: U32 family peptidase [Eubacteriales bacterium]